MDEGFILANKFRRVIFDELVAGENDIRRIAKKNRLIHGLRNVSSTSSLLGVLSKKKEISTCLLMTGKNSLIPSGNNGVGSLDKHMKPYLLQTLKELALLGAIHNKIELSSHELADQLQTSQQTASRYLLELDTQHMITENWG